MKIESIGCFDGTFNALVRNVVNADWLIVDALILKAHQTAHSLLKEVMYPAISNIRQTQRLAARSDST